MGGCCQVGGNKNDCSFVEENQPYRDNDNMGNFRGGNPNTYSSNVKGSFLDVNNNSTNPSTKTSFLRTDINVVEASKDNNDIVPEEFKPLVKNKSLIFNFHASLDEVIMPIWVNKGSKLRFHVIGQWNIFENDNFFTSSGIQDIGNENTPFGLPVGSLCGYIQGGDVFCITSESDFVARNSGPLVLFQNNGDYDVKPNGSLIVIMEGGVKQSLEEMENALGWDSRLLSEVMRVDFMSDDEKNILYYLNKLRSNPSLFGHLYLTHRKLKSSSDQECFDFLQTLTPISLLRPSMDLYRAAKMHATDMAMNNMTGHLSSNGKNLKDRLEGVNIDINKIGENCSYGISNPLAIVLELLVDETDSKGHRRNLLDANFQLVGISLEKHPYWGISCVQDFSRNL